MHSPQQRRFLAPHYQISRGRYFEVQSLINEGIGLNGKNCFGETPLMVAVRQSYKEIVELLIDSGAAIDCSDNDGKTALHYALNSGSVEIVRYLVYKGAAVNVKASCGETPLTVASGRAHKEIVEFLVHSGADIDCPGRIGETALHLALNNGSEEIVRWLVNKGAALNVKRFDGRTPLMAAVLYGCTCVWPFKEIVELLIDSGADIDSFDNEGFTALHLASYSRSVEMVRCLVNNGAALNVKSHYGETPLMVAANLSFKEIAELLINSGADINSSDNDGKTALHLTVKYWKLGIADYLLEAGADCNLEDNNGESSFSRLIKHKITDLNIIKLCIEKGAYVKSADYNLLLAEPLLKTFVLQDVKLCSQAVINKYNNKDLPLLYKGITSAQELPHIDIMKIGNESETAREVEKSVDREIKSKGFCNLFKMVPIVLGILCVKSVLERPVFKKASWSETQNGLKRLGYCNKHEYPCKKLCKL